MNGRFEAPTTVQSSSYQSPTPLSFQNRRTHPKAMRAPNAASARARNADLTFISIVWLASSTRSNHRVVAHRDPVSRPDEGFTIPQVEAVATLSNGMADRIYRCMLPAISGLFATAWSGVNVLPADPNAPLPGKNAIPRY